MPALRVHRDDGDQPWSVEGDQYFARQPHEALALLSKGAYRLLGAILYYHRPNRGDWIDETDDQLAERIAGRPCRGSVQRWFTDLEAGGWVKRVRRRGTRRIYLLFEWAGKSTHVPSALHGCSADEAPAPRILNMDGAPARDSSQKGRASRLCLEGDSQAPGPVAAEAPGGPPPRPPEPEPEPESDAPTWADLVDWRRRLQGEDTVLQRIAWTILSVHDRVWLEASNIAEPARPRVPGWPDQGSKTAAGPLAKGPRRPSGLAHAPLNLADPAATVKGGSLNET